ncbi:MAG: hypothetical protein LLG05_18075 [Porphyromonadaceae bacterium]|nr:hypothetical protein [Porphyromonadaceae bacterium]
MRIKKISYNLGCLIVAGFTHAPAQQPAKSATLDCFRWDNDLELPPVNGMSPNVGLAGVFSGISGNQLIIAGGANFPETMPWEGGTKKWWSTLYSLSTESEHAHWSVFENILPHPLAYGLSIQLPEGIVCLGGCDANRCYADVFLIRQTKQGPHISTDWPPLPVPLVNAAGALVDGKIYVVGGQEETSNATATSHFWVLDPQNRQKGWQALPSWPGPPRGFAVCAEANNKLYLFSGRNYKEDKLLRVLTDGYEYNPRKNEWITLKGEFPVMAGTAVAVNRTQLLLLGGVTEILPTDSNHPGFSRTVHVYDVKKQLLQETSILPYAIPVTTNVVRTKNTVYITSGEIKPGVRTPHILRGIKSTN